VDEDDGISMSIDELLALPVSVPLAVAARAFGLGRNKAYELAKHDQFPCRVIKVGERYRVPRSALLEVLGVKTTETLPPEEIAAWVNLVREISR
jgi:hypothetical protein